MKKRNEQEAFKLLTSGQLLALYRSYSRAGELKYASPVLEYLLESTYSDAERYFEKAVVLKEILRTAEALEACDKAILSCFPLSLADGTVVGIWKNDGFKLNKDLNVNKEKFLKHILKFF